MTGGIPLIFIGIQNPLSRHRSYGGFCGRSSDLIARFHAMRSDSYPIIRRSDLPVTEQHGCYRCCHHTVNRHHYRRRRQQRLVVSGRHCAVENRLHSQHMVRYDPGLVSQNVPGFGIERDIQEEKERHHLCSIARWMSFR